MLTFFFDCAGICSDPRTEASRVTICLNAAGPHDNVVAKILWADRMKAYTLALLQDRVAQVGDFFDSCQAVLALIHKVMFPLNDQYEGLHALMTRFKNGTPSIGLFDSISSAEQEWPWLSFGCAILVLI
jgi:hypothetical protein